MPQILLQLYCQLRLETAFAERLLPSQASGPVAVADRPAVQVHYIQGDPEFLPLRPKHYDGAPCSWCP